MDSTKLAKWGGWVAIAWGIVDPVATKLGIAAGLFTDFPGFSAWIAEKLGKALTSMSADSWIIILGCMMLAWGWFGDRIRSALGLKDTIPRQSPPAPASESESDDGIFSWVPTGPDSGVWRKHFKGKHVDIERHIGASGQLDSFVYEGCTLQGPAIVMFDDDCILENVMVADKTTAAELFLPVPSEVNFRGLWHASKCVLKNCELSLITMAATERQMPLMRASIAHFEPPEQDEVAERESEIKRWRDEVRRNL